MDDDELRGCAMVVGAILLALLLAVGIFFGGRELGWWLKADNTNRQAHIDRSNFAFQQTLRDQVTQHISDYQNMRAELSQPGIDNAGVSAQMHATANVICQEAIQITGDPLPADQQAWVSANCQYGSAR